MHTCTVQLESASIYQQGRPYDVDKLPKELSKDYEIRTWRERAHIGIDGKVFIPGNALKNCLSEAAKFLSIQVPGKGKATYTKHFEAGVLCMYNIPLPIKKKDLSFTRVFVPSDGRRGGSKRVYKNFPTIHEWSGECTFHIIDETITEDVFIDHLRQAGQYIGIGVYRPRNNGYHGRFNVLSHKWD